MSEIDAWAALQPSGALCRHRVTFGELGEFEVDVQVSHCGVCRSDVHLVDDDWGHGTYPLVPGHEIIGEVRARGARVHELAIGTRVGIGWQASSCGVCPECTSGRENLCPEQQATCVGRTGGFADRVRVDARFAYPIPDAIASEHAAPLLCAGATVFAPLRRHRVGPGARVGVIGLGGLGHLAVMFARIIGAEVTVFSSSADKQALALELGAARVVDSIDRKALAGERGRHDLILSTVHTNLDWTRYVQALRPSGTLCFLGIPSERLAVPIGLLVDGERSISGSVVASRAVMREMLDFAAQHRVVPIIERIPMDEAERALDRVRSGLARLRVVLVR